MRGAATGLPLTYARVDGLEPHKTSASERAGHLSGSDRATRCPIGISLAARNNPSRPSPVGGVNELVKYADVDANRRRVKNLDMTIVEITGDMLRAARSLTGLSQQEVADHASISRTCLTAMGGAERQSSQCQGARSASRRLNARGRRCPLAILLSRHLTWPRLRGLFFEARDVRKKRRAAQQPASSVERQRAQAEVHALMPL